MNLSGQVERPLARVTTAIGGLMLVIAMLVAGPARAQSSAELDAAIEKLKVEGKAVIDRGDAATPVMTRPHPALKNLPENVLPAVLDRIGSSFTGNAQLDTYGRWHLLWLVERALDTTFETFRETGEATPSPEIARTLVDLIRTMPPQPAYHWQNPVVAGPEEVVRREGQIERAIDDLAVEIGFPPFNQRYTGRDALPHLQGQRKAQLQRLLDELAQVRSRITRRTDAGIERQNEIARFLSRIIRTYRGDLMYAIVRSGDAATLRRAASEIARLADDHQRAGYDLLAYMYLASFDGSLSLYDPDALEAVRRELESAARRNDQYVQLMDGDKPTPDFVVPGVRNFADYSFHMRELLRSPDIVRQFLARGRRDDAPPAKPVAPIDPDELTIADIRGAIDRATAFLADPPVERGVDFKLLEPNYGIRDDTTMRSIHHRWGQANDPVRRQAMLNEVGNHAAMAWAMLSSGRTYQDPQLFKRVNWIFSADTPFTYDRAMRVLMASQLSADRWGPYLRRDVDWLLASMTDKGGFNAEYYGKRDDGWGDHAHGQFAAVALAAAADAGIDVPSKAWDLIDKHWRLSQADTDGEAAGWALGMLGAAAKAQEEENPDQAGGNGGVDRSFQSRVTAPMTAGGVATLVATERLRSSGSSGFSPELRKGLAWLDRHFRVEEAGPDVDWYFYMWTMQRVGQASGYARFNGVDWFREVTAAMINRQSPLGYWDDARDRVGMGPSTAFALLYLGSALDPIGISKIRYGGQWNERPTDLWNFVDYVSDQYEHATRWRIVDVDQPVHELIESPLLYLSAGERFTLEPAEIETLRNYVLAGGMLLINPDRATPGVTQSITSLLQSLFPGQELQPIDPEDPLYRLHRDVRPTVQMRAIHNGVRPLVITFVRDIGEDLQKNSRITSDVFGTLSNLYLYAVGKNPRRTRLQTYYRRPIATMTSTTVEAARIVYDGMYDPEPEALTQLGRVLQAEHQVTLEVMSVEPAKLSRSTPLAFLTTRGVGELSEAEATAVRQWVEQGGTLWLDAAGGSKTASDAAFAMVRQLAPAQAPMPMRPDHPVLTGEGLRAGAPDNTTVKYRRYAMQRMAPTNRPRLQTITLGRGEIIFSPEDLTAGWAGLEHWGIFGYDVDTARDLGVSAVLRVVK